MDLCNTKPFSLRGKAWGFFLIMPKVFPHAAAEYVRAIFAFDSVSFLSACLCRVHYVRRKEARKEEE